MCYCDCLVADFLRRASVSSTKLLACFIHSVSHRSCTALYFDTIIVYYYIPTFVCRAASRIGASTSEEITELG